MKDLYQAIHSNFDKPDYWHDKEQSYYSLFAKFMKVCLLCKNAVEYFYIVFLLLALSHIDTHLRSSCSFKPNRERGEDGIPVETTIVMRDTRALWYVF